jgi:hypothetical protein
MPNTFVDFLAWISQIIGNRFPPILFNSFQFQFRRTAAPLCSGSLTSLCGSLISLRSGLIGLGGGQTDWCGGQTVRLCIE